MDDTSAPNPRTRWRSRHTPPHKRLLSSRNNHSRSIPAELRPSPCGRLLLEIDRETIPKSVASPRITECRYLSSYSWIDKPSPTVLIPGKPAAWNRPAIARQLKPDSGNYFRDQNAAWYAAHPMQPAVQAVLQENPGYNTSSVDIFSCSSVLGNLSRFARGVKYGFRFIMEAVGDTVFLVRQESSPTLLIQNVRGFGHNFTDEHTTWEADVKGSISHMRIIQYRFGGLRFAVRFSSDCYVKKEKSQNRTKTIPTNPRSLTGMLIDVSVHPDKIPDSSPLAVQRGGSMVPQRDICDIKTRYMVDFKTGAIVKGIDKADIVPRLWVSQIPTLIAAFHNKGVFKDIQMHDMRGEVAAWERENEDNLRQLASLLRTLVNTAMEHGVPIEVYCPESGPLEVRVREGGPYATLPPEVKAEWVGGGRDSPKHDDTALDGEGDKLTEYPSLL